MYMRYLLSQIGDHPRWTGPTERGLSPTPLGLTPVLETGVLAACEAQFARNA
jgi:hypothetical protein